MTFTEAAAQVLRLVGKPLHYKEITDVAIEKNLLSHVGKSPEVTMGARLAALVKKGDKDNPLVRVKPGVFALREWDKSTIDKGLADRTPALERIAALPPAADPVPLPVTEEAATEADAPTVDEADEPLISGSYPEIEEEEARPPDQEELARAEMRAGATELFAPEADDDEPIFGSDDEEDEEGGLDRDAGSRRRRRRRRRGRSTETRGDDLPSYTVSDVPAHLAELNLDAERATAERPAVERAPERERSRDRERGGRDPDRERLAREPERERGGRESDRDRERDRSRDGERDRSRDGERDRSRDGERDRSRDGERDRGREADRDRDVERLEPRDGAKATGEEPVGRDLADAIQQIIAGFDRNRGLVGVQILAEAAQRRGRLGGDLQASQGLITAAVRADNLRRAALGQRQRFRIVGNRVGLTDWLLDGELVRIEREIMTLSERYRETLRKGLVRKLQELPHRAVGELLILVLERLGMSELQPIRRTGAHGAELHLSGKASSPAGELRAAVVIRRDGREIGRERVTELRGALHHYGPAHAGWLITTGQVLSGAREEASASGAAPISLLDGVAVARLCEEHGMGVVHTRISLPMPDVELFEGLRQG
jgi:hypothetical protein